MARACKTPQIRRRGGADLQVCRVVGVESKTYLGFAALHRLLIPFHGLLEGLPAPQRAALASTFGLTERNLTS